MEMSNFSPELHVAQRSRRDKLRVQQNSEPPRHFAVYRSICSNPSAYSSKTLNFAPNEQSLLPNKDDIMVHQESRVSGSDKRVEEASSFVELQQTISSTFNPSGPHGDAPLYVSTWNGSNGVQPQLHPDWSAGYISNSAGIGSNPLSILDFKSCHGQREVYPTLSKPSTEIPYQNVEKHHNHVHHTSSLYQAELHEVIRPPIGGPEMPFPRQQNAEVTSHDSWSVGGGELLLLPAFADHTRFKSSTDDLIRRQTSPRPQCGELDYLGNRSADIGDSRMVVSDNSTQGLSLALSSVPSGKVNGGGQFFQRDPSDDVNSRKMNISSVPDSETLNSEYLSSNSNPIQPNASNGLGVPSQDAVRKSTFAYYNLGPLGPFTGYATILRSSKFLKPAQHLLDELCNSASPRPIELPEVSNSRGQFRVSGDGVSGTAGPVIQGGVTGDSRGSLYPNSTNDQKGCEPGSARASTSSRWPEYLQRKAKLLSLQDEVSRRYKQYHQQMQMVVSSFESVAGLSSAVPYISLALNTVAGHFRGLKNAIADQLRSISNTLREDLSSPTADATNSKADTDSARLKFIDSCFLKPKNGGNLGFLETQRAWRPQRGLPEHAVSILRAWLFDHFLHPYPTDTDKHMLAAKTGLTRNQVSNWFINARVRVWKPMVEEIHVLETKEMAETGRPDEGNMQTNGNQTLNQLEASAAAFDKQTSLSDCMVNRFHPKLLNQESHSRVEYCVSPASIGGSLMGFPPYHQGGMEMGGLGSVSLTLGLRRTAESAQQRPQTMQHFRQHFGDHIGA